MSAKLLDHIDSIDQDRTLAWEDNFLWYISPHMWTATLTDSGTVTVLTTHGGGITIAASDGSVVDNDQSYLAWTNICILPTLLKPIMFQATVIAAEANTSAANWVVALSSISTAELLIDDGAGIAASLSGLGFYKVDGGLNWNIFASVGATQTKAELTVTNSLNKKANVAGSSSKQTLRVFVEPYTSTKAWVTWFIDDVPVYKLDWTYTSVVAMAPTFGVKGGSSTAELLKVYNAKLKTLR